MEEIFSWKRRSLPNASWENKHSMRQRDDSAESGRNNDFQRACYQPPVDIKTILRSRETRGKNDVEPALNVRIVSVSRMFLHIWAETLFQLCTIYDEPQVKWQLLVIGSPDLNKYPNDAIAKNFISEGWLHELA